MFIAAHERDAYTVEELKNMFSNNWDEDNEIKLFSIVAAVTGMRLGEVTSIRKEYLFTNLDVSDQINRTGEARKIRICEIFYKMLKELTDKNDYAFVSRNTKQRDVFYKHYLIALISSFAKLLVTTKTGSRQEPTLEIRGCA